MERKPKAWKAVPAEGGEEVFQASRQAPKEVKMINKLWLFAVNNTEAEKLLVDSGVTMVRGCYKGEEEPSFLTTSEALAYENAKKHNQESILKLTRIGLGLNKWQATLLFIDPMKSFMVPEMDLGIFEEVDEVYAKRQESWTEIDGRFYVTEAK